MPKILRPSSLFPTLRGKQGKLFTGTLLTLIHFPAVVHLLIRTYTGVPARQKHTRPGFDYFEGSGSSMEFLITGEVDDIQCLTQKTNPAIMTFQLQIDIKGWGNGLKDFAVTGHLIVEWVHY